ncbi:magnesium chelatase domain-containing protein, partial [Streptomyces niveus]|uniref:magnesium chelatase domain-containing protein n=1 Tax=Streptomyces niveus TaxID=193462 RepID=UPI00343B8579
MGFARACSVALVGVEGVVVEVQADLEPGVAAFTLVGLPDKSLSESRDRVRAAVVFPVKFLSSALRCLLMSARTASGGGLERRRPR